MDQKIKERCIYCGADVYYNGEEVLLKCGMCGHTLVVARFECELMKMKEAEAEKEKARQALEAAEQEKQQAQKRLHNALEALSNIQCFQAEEIDSLAKIALDVSDNKEQQSAMMTLLQSIKEASEDEHETLGKLLQALTRGQQSDDEKLAVLQNIAAKILASQDNAMAKVQAQSEIVTRLYSMEMEAMERQRLANDFMLWIQNVREEDLVHMQAVSEASDKLL